MVFLKPSDLFSELASDTYEYFNGMFACGVDVELEYTSLCGYF